MTGDHSHAIKLKKLINFRNKFYAFISATKDITDDVRKHFIIKVRSSHHILKHLRFFLPLLDFDFSIKGLLLQIGELPFKHLNLFCVLWGFFVKGVFRGVLIGLNILTDTEEDLLHVL